MKSLASSLLPLLAFLLLAPAVSARDDDPGNSSGLPTYSENRPATLPTQATERRKSDSGAAPAARAPAVTRRTAAAATPDARDRRIRQLEDEVRRLQRQQRQR